MNETNPAFMVNKLLFMNNDKKYIELEHLTKAMNI